MRTSDSKLDYLPTQYISDFIKSAGFDGIGYESVMHRPGYNIVSFLPAEEGFDLQGIAVFDIRELEYKYGTLKNTEIA